jgi:hypothetical protein
LNVVEAKSHNNNIISHNLQENKDKKMQGKYPQTFPPTTINNHSSCRFLTFGGHSNNASSN